MVDIRNRDRSRGVDHLTVTLAAASLGDVE
jgi:hypothetical protein